MKKNYFKKFLLLSGVFFYAALSAQTSGDGLWTISGTKTVVGEKTRRSSFPENYFLANLDLALLKSRLMAAPVLHSGIGQPVILEFPNAEGVFEKFSVYESSIMDPVLEAKFPMIKTYAAQGIDDPTATMRFSITQFGLHSMVLSGQKSTCYIDPYTTDLITYIVYDRASLGADSQPFTCLTEEDVALPSLQKTTAAPLVVANINDQKLRTYRLAQSCTGEYGTIFKGTGTTAQQKANVQAQMVITMNRVNGVYERDLSIRMNFIANNDLLIYLLAASDPWTTEWNTKTAQTIDAAIGINNYDIGHNFNTTGGGSAGCLSCVCVNTSQTGMHKGRGYTGRANPTGDAFDIDYVAHEMGHQFGGYHVMNTCSRSGNGTTEVEPGSGSSIMGYAGICATNQNVQANSHDDFNYVNIRDISNNIKTGNSTCGAVTALTNNPPTANAGMDYVIPKSTPFILEGTATDADGMASLTYNWSQNDFAQSPGNGAPQATYATGPMYRSIAPLTSPNRYMPALSTVIANNLSSTWEVTASVTRTLNFSFIVRDNAVGGGQTASDLMRVYVNGTAGPFSVTSQSTATTWTVGTTQTINWNVAGTTASPVSTPSVNIFLSLDGGNTYPITLATNRANNGSTTITVPSSITTTGRIMVRGAGNIFYDLNNGVITIKAATAASPVSSFTLASSNLCTGSAISLNDQSLNTPTTWTWSATSSTGVTFSNVNAQHPTVTFANAGTYTISLLARNATGSSTSTRTVTINATPTIAVNSATICSGNPAVLTASGATGYSWNTSATTASVSVSPAATTSYTVTGNSNGCSASQTALVTVKATPTVTANNTSVCNGSPAVITASGATTYAWSTSATTSSISVTPTATTNYTVTGTTNGCANVKVVTVTINSTPTISVNSSTICSGSSVSLNATGASTYSWNTSANSASISVSPATTTSYTVTGFNGSCSDTKVANVTVNTLPSVALFLSSAAVICVNAPQIGLTGSPAGGNFSGTGVSGNAFTPSVAGAGTFTISYTYTDANTCTNSDQAVMVVDLCTGINEITNTEFVIYPNPTSGVFTVEFGSGLESVNLEVFDAIGKLVVAKTNLTSSTPVSLEEFAKGIYTVRISHEGNYKMIRIIKQ